MAARSHKLTSAPAESPAPPPSDAAEGLDRLFPVIAFDWDGTAVVDRAADAALVRSRIERLCALGVDVAVVSGTDLKRVDGQLHARPGAEGRLFYLLSRGSEVFVVGPAGPRLLERRQATPDEDANLTAAAEAVRDDLAARGLAVEVIVDRLNRRKIDLIPELTDPRKSELAQLLRATLARLATVGITGIDEVIEIARQRCQELGLSHAAIISDLKHVEIGLTDKADSMRYILRYLLRERSRQPEDMVLLGDEFGPVGASEGSDYRTLIPELRGSLFASVGPEPGGAPPRVLHVGGGPERFLGFLDDQIARRSRVARENFPVPDRDQDWIFAVDGFDPFREREVETWLTVANGETGTRGSLEEGSAISTPATFVAGVFGDGTSDPIFRQPVPAPDWLCLRLLVDGDHLTLANGEILKHRRVLDMKQGVVFREWLQRNRAGNAVRVRTARFASLADRHLLALRAEAVPQDTAGRLIWEGAVGITHAGGPTREAAFEKMDTPGFIARTKGRKGGGHVLAVSTTPAEGSPIARHVEQSRDILGGRLEPGDPATVDRLAAIFSGRSSVPSTEVARRGLAEAEKTGYDELLRRHREAWGERWRDADVVIDGDPTSQLSVRFAIFHMIATGHPTKETVSVGARGLGGMSYFLHVFWDTEIFVLPFFIFTHPQTARTLLTYRYRNLDGARVKARQMGHKGALFPWESADKGTETTPPYGVGPLGEKVPILSGLMEHHISADVAWGVWEYWKATGDDDFMITMGAEIMLETARFWASRANPDPDRQRYHINMVVGPDEYHEGVDDNAYTNVMARWNIRKAMAALDWLQRFHPEAATALSERMGITVTELFGWRTTADKLVDGFDPETKLFEQFEGFYDLADVDPESIRPRPLAADLLLGRDVTLHSKVVKQADAVMLCYVLSDEIDESVARANYDYYEPITCHGSSLSPGIHAALAAQLGNVEQAVEQFAMACAIDLADNMGNAARGLHMATMGGLWQASVMGFGGVRRRDEAVVIDPHLPEVWTRLRFPMLFRGARLEFDISRDEKGRDRVGVTVANAPVAVILGERERTFEPGDYLFSRVPGKAWKETKR